MLGQQALGSSGWAVPDSVPTTFCRDLKAANLLMDDNGIVKIGDFGVARVMDTLGVMTAETGTYRWVLLLAPRLCGKQTAVLCGSMCGRRCCRGDGLQSMLGRSWRRLSRQQPHLCVLRSLHQAPARTPCPFKYGALKTASTTVIAKAVTVQHSCQIRECQLAPDWLQVDGPRGYRARALQGEGRRLLLWHRAVGAAHGAGTLQRDDPPAGSRGGGAEGPAPPDTPQHAPRAGRAHAGGGPGVQGAKALLQCACGRRPHEPSWGLGCKMLRGTVMRTFWLAAAGLMHRPWGHCQWPACVCTA